MLATEEIRLRRERKRGHPTEQVGFRCPKELVQAIDAEGPDQSKGAVALLDRAVDSRSEIGDLWIEVVVLAHREGITEGAALGRIAREALERTRKSRK